MSARNTALAALIACRKTNAWSDGILKEYIVRDRLDARDAALASRLCYGVVQNRMLLDFYITSFLKGKLKDLQPVVLEILRLAVYQLTMMDRIPDSAAVNEAVEQGKKYANPRAAGLINGLLRALVRAEGALPEPPDLATRYSHPAQLVEILRENVGDALLEPLLQANNEAPSTVVQINTLKISESAIRAQWEEQGLSYVRHPWLSGCYALSNTGNLEAFRCFRNGTLYVQDAAAKLAVDVMQLKPDMRVLDCCAAPGGKSFSAALAMKNRGELFSCDIHKHKISLIERGALRLGIDIITAQEQNAQAYRADWEDGMDAVLADVPCSGLGVIRKKPDIRYKDLLETERLPGVQLKILNNVSRYVKPGGQLLYSTCTILKRENEQVVEAFLTENPSFSLERIELPPQLDCANEGMVTLLPCIHDCDGFFIAKLRKTL